MFISLNIFILLILLTIIMLALIVFLTFTGGPSRKKQHKKIEHPQHSQPQKERTDDLQQQNSTHDYLASQQQQENLESPAANQYTPTHGGNDFQYLNPNNETPIYEPLEEDNPFSILPYPKETVEEQSHEDEHTE